MRKLTLKEAIHKLGNKQCLTIFVSSVYVETFKELLEKENLPSRARQALEKLIHDMEGISDISKQAYDLLKEIKKEVYVHIDPDKIKMDLTEIINQEAK